MFKKEIILAAVLSLSFVGAAPAIPIASTNLDLVLPGAGPLFAGPIIDSFVAALPPPATIGSMTNNVYFDGSIYTYTHAVTPTINNISELNTAFGVNGWNGVAGFSWSQSLAAGGPGNGSGFSIELDPDQTIDWQVDPNNKFWGANETITFFFQSTLAPGLGDYNMVNGEVGTARSYAPVPEPSAYLLFGSALALFALRRRKKSA